MPDEDTMRGCRVWPDTWREAQGFPVPRGDTTKHQFTAAGICEEAARLVAGERDRTHGNKLDNHANIAAMWNAYLGEQLTQSITPTQAALMMACLKIARTKIGAHNIDDYIDGAGYFACAAEIVEREGK